jgi:hypothetical protein
MQYTQSPLKNKTFLTIIMRRDSPVLAPPGSRDSPVLAPPGSRDSPVPAPPGSRDSPVLAPPGSFSTFPNL